jgi:hypothetical protein
MTSCLICKKLLIFSNWDRGLFVLESGMVDCEPVNPVAMAAANYKF